MIWLAVLVELFIYNLVDMYILLGIQFLNASLSYYETTKAGDAVAALKASLKPLAHVKRDGTFQTLDAGLLVPGDLVSLGSGGAVPADCVVNEGTIDVDQVCVWLRKLYSVHLLCHLLRGVLLIEHCGRLPRFKSS